MRYLTLDQVLFIHAFLLKKYGGLSGLQSLELLESSLYRPRSSFDGVELYSTVFAKAACLMHSLVKNHPFNDGNKRTASVAGIAFLRMNGFTINIPSSALYELALEIATDKLSLAKLSDLLSENSVKEV